VHSVATLPAQITYAKNAAHNQFLHSFDGKLKGRYCIAFLVGIEFIGGPELRREIEGLLGNPKYPLDEWCSARDLIVMFDRAVRAGIAPERIGLLTMPAYKRSYPEVFEGKTLRDGLIIFDHGYRADTTYGGVSPGSLIEPTRAFIHRTGSPLPCDYFIGVIKGLFGIFSIEGEVREVQCQWDGAPACRFEARWPG
jgi:hypothetical protein